ncbi:NUDIX family hydrolase [Natronomonas pharaonis DSM 2160]|uniref:NUDIX family hydrolase n=1 Tax=Natronomonas pharaonis (strain ATCC 35678 / DSM 2160 / CIP 103997 / JCM 8858 / NBRC 14720 / NCIMB 2260 / Gabara) TaxID=348780 RepID=A0A1U7EYK5_NATPD|nr:hypothetical protein [Natronomonas pharaonis]CAI50338.1 NUDIX family hydrolase [Natronomonas pharaonis DSM 2160]
MNGSGPGAVSQYLDALYAEYDRFDVQQTTVAVTPSEFDELDDHGCHVSVRVHVKSDENGVLVRRDGDEWTLPGGEVTAEPLDAAAADLAERQTGVACEVRTLRQVAVVCLQCEPRDDEVWELSAEFVAEPVGGTPADRAEWQRGVDLEPISPP